MNTVIYEVNLDYSRHYINRSFVHLAVTDSDHYYYYF